MPTSTRKTSSSPRKRANSTNSSKSARRGKANSGASSRSKRKAPRGRLRWCLAHFVWFCEQLTLPVDDVDYDGPPKPFKLDPFQLFILKEVFERGRSELLVLLPKGNGKTCLFAALAVYHLLTVRNAECFIAAADAEQAKTMYRFARHFVESEPELAALLEIRQSMREIRSKRDLGFIRVLASDQSKAGGRRHSYNPTLALIDELHAHDNDSLYTALRSATFKRGGVVVTISTAGHDEENSTLGIKRARCYAFAHSGGTLQRGLRINARGQLIKDPRRGRLTIARSPSRRTCMLEWACRKDDDLDNMAVVKLANPATFVTVEGLEDAHEALEPSTFQRYRANVWAQAADARIAEAKWEVLFEKGAKIPPNAEDLFIVVDAAQKRDTAAATLMWRRPDKKIVVKSKVWALLPKDPRRPKPPAHQYVAGERIGQRRIRNHIRKQMKTYRLAGLIYDPMFFGESAEILEEDDGLDTIEFLSNHKEQAPATERLLEAIDNREIVHDGDPVLRSHALAAATKAVGESNERFSKAASGKVIDALITLMIGIEIVAEGEGSSVYEERGVIVL